MNRFLRWVLWWPLGLVIVAFLVANRQDVALSLDPFSVTNPAISTPELPLWFWLAAALLAGFFLGAAGMWNSGRTFRRQVGAERRELKMFKEAAAAAKKNDTPTDSSETALSRSTET
jgi:hypothetical protein